MNSKLISLLLVLVTSLTVYSQTQPLLTIGDKTFGVEEFNYIYNKNNSLSKTPLSKEAYLSLFVNYKLKVIEAESQQLDTLPSFIKELNYYRDELSKPYLTDEKAQEAVVKEAYDHMVTEVNASHILIKLPRSPMPEDTLAAYKKIKDVLSQINNGADFGEMAVKYSEDPSAVSNKGNLGFFSGFMMVYPFEEAAYKTPVGKVSPIVRTSFGYHIIKVHAKRTNPGEVKVAHIMKLAQESAPDSVKLRAKVVIDSLYQAVVIGSDFADLATDFSDDRQSAVKGGELPWFSTGRMVAEFSDAAFALKANGDYSKPIKTSYGWHIIKRIDAKPIGSLEENRAEIEKKIERSDRRYEGQKATIERLKAEYNFKVDTQKLNQLANIAFEAKSKSSELSDQYKALVESNLIVTTFADVELQPGDVMRDLVEGGYSSSYSKREDFIPIWYKFSNDQLINYEKSKLEQKYPAFKYLINEYHDGLLIFEISQKEVWNKANTDSAGLESYFEANALRYQLPERFDGVLYYCSKKKDVKTMKAFLATSDSLPFDSLPGNLVGEVTVEKGVFAKGTNPALDAKEWGVKSKVKTKTYLLTKGEIKKPESQKLEAVRGQVVSDYQVELERIWVKYLNDKYKPVVNKSALVEKENK